MRDGLRAVKNTIEDAAGGLPCLHGTIELGRVCRAPHKATCCLSAGCNRLASSLPAATVSLPWPRPPAVVPGAGAFEVAAAHHLRTVTIKKVEGRAKLGVEAFAEVRACAGLCLLGVLGVCIAAGSRLSIRLLQPCSIHW